MHNWESSTQQDQALSAAEIDTLLDEDNDDGERGTSSSTTITARFRRHRSLVAVTILMSLVSVAGSLYYIYYSRPSSQSDLNSLSELSSSNSEDNDTPPDETDESQQKNKLFAHLHVAKSGGTSLLYELAHLYQNVCGNKYNSKNLVEKNPDLFKGFKGSDLNKLLQLQDQCDYMSLEVMPIFWLQQNWTRPLELHIPCKDPIELLMSNCYWPPKSNVGFDCSPTNVTPNALRHQIDNCLNFNERLRFNKALSEQAPRHNITIKCFDAKKEFTEYIDYMGARLEHYPKVEDLVRFSKKEDGELVTVERPWSFSARNKSAECIWKDSDLLQRAKVYLFEKYFYFPFCRECLNSSDNLLAK